MRWWCNDDDVAMIIGWCDGDVMILMQWWCDDVAIMMWWLCDDDKMIMMQYNEMKGYYNDKPCSEGYVISNISYNHFVNM